MSEQPYTVGRIVLEDANKPIADYTPPRKAVAEITFSYLDPAEAERWSAHAAKIASARVDELLGRATQATTGEAPATTTRRRRTKAEIEADNAAALAGAKQNSGAGGAQTSADPASVEEDPTAGQEAVIHLPDETNDPASIGDDAAEVGLEDEWDVPVEEAVTEITDADLNSEVQRKNAELKAPDQIRALIGSYNPDKSKPFQLRQITQADRAGFIAKLKALKAAA